MKILTAAFAVICMWKWGISGKALTAYIFLLFLLSAAWKDRMERRIPDNIVIAAGLAGILSIPFFTEISLADRGIGVICVSVLLLCITLAAPGSFGGGDIKLTAASGIFLGWEASLRAFILAVFIAGAYCIWRLAQGKLSRKEQIAFGPFLCAGIIIEVFCGRELLFW